MISHDNSDTKFIARRLVLVAMAVLLGALAIMWPMIVATIEDQLYPPVPQPAYATRLENHARGCWDVLSIRHDENTEAVILTIMKLCEPKPESFEEFLFDDLTRIVQSELRIQPATFFMTEWVEVKRDEVFVAFITVCDAVRSSVDVRTANCSATRRLNRVVPKLERRNWWVADFNSWRNPK